MRTRTIVVLLGLLAVAASYDLFMRARIGAINSAIAEGSIATVESGLSPLALFCKAYWLDRQGKRDQAIVFYQQVERVGDPELKLDARYNASNILLRQALEARASDEVLPLVELAKEGYRAVLRENSQHWDAKYNLERALKLAPDTHPSETAGSGPSPGRERAITTMKGVTLGLP
ncbi:MAG TPA: hypothetical protein VLA73_10945 [Burkholderiales bacterium]|nr:hypothetical protein [Burkholderiales bacterium]